MGPLMLYFRGNYIDIGMIINNIINKNNIIIVLTKSKS